MTGIYSGTSQGIVDPRSSVVTRTARPATTLNRIVLNQSDGRLLSDVRTVSQSPQAPTPRRPSVTKVLVMTQSLAECGWSAFKAIANTAAAWMLLIAWRLALKRAPAKKRSHARHDL
jgi:hypothetical protein